MGEIASAIWLGGPLMVLIIAGHRARLCLRRPQARLAGRGPRCRLRAAQGFHTCLTCGDAFSDFAMRNGPPECTFRPEGEEGVAVRSRQDGHR